MLNFQFTEMLKSIEINKDMIENETKNYKGSDDIYAVLLKTGQYINSKDLD